jgi:hypothetical protein
VLDERQDETHRVHVGIAHQPEEMIVLLGGEAERGATDPQAGAQLLLDLGDVCRVGTVRGAVQEAPPVDERRGRPERRLDGDRAHERGLNGADTRERRRAPIFRTARSAVRSGGEVTRRAAHETTECLLHLGLHALGEDRARRRSRSRARTPSAPRCPRRSSESISGDRSSRHRRGGR